MAKQLSRRLREHASGEGPGAQMTEEEWIEHARSLLLEASERIAPSDEETVCEACGECFGIDQMVMCASYDDGPLFFCKPCDAEEKRNV